MFSRGGCDNIADILNLVLQVDCWNNDRGASESEQGCDQPVPGQDCGKEPTDMHQRCRGTHKGETHPCLGLLLFPIKSRGKFHLDSFPW